MNVDWQQDPVHKRCYRALPGGPTSDFRLSISKASEYRWDEWMPRRQSERPWAVRVDWWEGAVRVCLLPGRLTPIQAKAAASEIFRGVLRDMREALDLVERCVECPEEAD